MKAKMSKTGIYLEYEINEHDGFLEKRRQYEGAGIDIEAFNGQQKEKSWIRAAKWLPTK